MSATTPTDAMPIQRLRFPEPIHRQYARSFQIQMDANELIELLEWAGQGAYSLGWPELGRHYDDRQTALLRRLQRANQPVYYSHA